MLSSLQSKDVHAIPDETKTISDIYIYMVCIRISAQVSMCFLFANVKPNISRFERQEFTKSPKEKCNNFIGPRYTNVCYIARKLRANELFI